MVSIQLPKSSKTGKPPVDLQLNPPIRRGDIGLLNYICNSLIIKNARLVPFMWENESTRLLARHYYLHETSSPNTLQSVAITLNSFLDFTGRNPDEIISSLMDQEYKPIPKAVKRLKRDIEDWQAELKGQDYAPGSIKVLTGYVKAWLQVNDTDVGKLPQPKSYVKYPVSSFRAEEIERLIDIADLIGKVIVSSWQPQG